LVSGISEKDFEIPEKLKVPRISETTLSQKKPYFFLDF